MKIFIGTIFAVLLFAGTSCQQAVDIEKDKEAILAILNAEGDAALAKDIEWISDKYVQDELTTRLEMGQYGYNRYEGWEEVEGLLGDFLGGEGSIGGDNPVNRKENVILKVMENSAWLTCDNIWEWTIEGETGGYNNIQIMFFEKVKGDWKISFSAYYTKPNP
jgi:hypothetical protein